MPKLEVRRRGNYIRERVENPKHFDRKSLRTIKRGKHKVIIGCPKGNWLPATKVCIVGTRKQSILHPLSEWKKLCSKGHCKVR